MEEKKGKKIDFERMEIFTNIAKTECVVQDVRTTFADIIYNRCSGIEAHALAMKIYQSSSDTEYNEKECQLIIKCAGMCTPAFIDSVTKATEKSE